MRRSVGLRPQINQSNRLDARRADLVEVTNPLRLSLEIVIELFETFAPRAHVCFELTLVILVVAKCQLLERALVFGELFTHAFELAFERLAKILFFALPALA